jgi:peptide/nickel transport system substrate-binding protein
VLHSSSASVRLPRRFSVPLALAGALGLWACGGGGGGGTAEKPLSEGEPKRGGTLIWTSPSDFDALNNFVSTDYETQEANRYVLFMTLIQYDKDMNLVPYLAESWELAPDGLSVTYHIRKDVKWHDGTPTTAEDVKFTYERCKDPKVAYANAATFEYYTGAEILDPYTIRFTFSQPFADPVENLALWTIMPKHLLEKVPVAELRNAPFNRNPVGNGPFKFVRWTANQEIVFEANDAFSPSLGGRPYLDRIVLRIVPEQTTELTMLLTGQSDLLRAVQPQEGARVEASDVARLIVFPSRAYDFIGWNERLPMFDSPEERQALTMAINRQQMVAALLYGYGKVAATDGFETMWVSDSTLKPRPYDPEKAKALLAGQGWKDSDGDGVLDQDGRRFEFRLLVNKGNDLRSDGAIIVKNDLAKIGVVAEPTVREWTVLLQETQRKEYEAWLGGWQLDFVYNPRDLFHSQAIDGKYNFVSFKNATADSLIDLGISIPDRAQSKPVWLAFFRLMAEQQPYTWLYTLNERVGVSRRLRGVETMDTRGYIRDIRHWWIAS